MLYTVRIRLVTPLRLCNTDPPVGSERMPFNNVSDTLISPASKDMKQQIASTCTT